jgi:nucleotide-binding universal stress UspA family protein
MTARAGRVARPGGLGGPAHDYPRDGERREGRCPHRHGGQHTKPMTDARPRWGVPGACPVVPTPFARRHLLSGRVPGWVIAAAGMGACPDGPTAAPPTCSMSNHKRTKRPVPGKPACARRRAPPPRGLMTITQTNPRPRLRRPPGTSGSAFERCRPVQVEPDAAPIVVAVDNSPAAAAAARAAVRLAQELAAPLVFVYARGGPVCGVREAVLPASPRRRDARRAPRPGPRPRGRRASGCARDGEQLEGNPARLVVELARHRGARLIALGSRRLRRGRSVSRKVIRSADRPVLVADPTEPAAA